MITQNFDNGKSKIRVESAEDFDDAQKNGFSENEYSRYFIDNKPVSGGYMGMVQSIIEETRKSGNRFIPPTDKDLKKKQKEIINMQKESFRNSIKQLRKTYEAMNVPVQLLAELDRMADNIDLAGVRVKE